METMVVRRRPDDLKQLIYVKDFDGTKHVRISGQSGVPTIPAHVEHMAHGVSPHRATNEFDELKAKADELGIKYGPRIGAERLKARIEQAEQD